MKKRDLIIGALILMIFIISIIISQTNIVYADNGIGAPLFTECYEHLNEIEYYNNHINTESFKELNLHPVITSGKGLTPEQTTMYFLACYDLDNFREFIFQSNFFNFFKIDEKIKEKVKFDDEALLDFAFSWLRFSLLGEPTLTLKEEVLKRKKAALGLDKI